MSLQTGKGVSFVIGAAILGAVIFVLVQVSQHPQTEGLRVSFKDKVGIFLDNLSEGVSPGRKPPLSTIELEESLKANLVNPFGSFSRQDWDWFWQLLYGRFTDDESGWPRRKRQLTRWEIEDTLVEYYYQPFGYFGEKQWGIFWQHVMKGKVF